MSVSDLDVWRSANELIKKHGGEAANFAAIRADALLDQGDVQGHAVWVRIINAIDDLQRTQKKPGERMQ